MDGLFYHMSNTNIGLSACTGSSPCKLNLSPFFSACAFFFIHSFFFSLCMSEGVWLSWLVFTSSNNICVILPLSEHVSICVDLLCKPHCIQMTLYRPKSCQLYLERKDWVPNPKLFFFTHSSFFNFVKSLLLLSLFFSFSNPSYFFHDI